jgi:hypothetical protein
MGALQLNGTVVAAQCPGLLATLWSCLDFQCDCCLDILCALAKALGPRRAVHREHVTVYRHRLRSHGGWYGVTAVMRITVLYGLCGGTTN